MEEIVIGDAYASLTVNDREVYINVPFDVDTFALNEEQIEELTNALNTRWAEKHSIRNIS